jgi:L-serine dehydratase
MKWGQHMQGVFDIIGPIMIGPSSSHTAGAVRLGIIAGKILGEDTVKAEINLHGSFAKTYRGHGTDKAIIAGIMGFMPDDERIRDALSIATKKGMEYQFQPVNLENAHPNTVVIYLTGKSGRVARVRGASIGGGTILVTNIDGYDVELTGQYPAIIIIHRDCPGVITKVTSILSRYELNIAFMRVSRQNRGEAAMMIIEMDDVISEDVIDECKQVYEVQDAFSIPAI